METTVFFVTAAILSAPPPPPIGPPPVPTPTLTESVGPLAPGESRAGREFERGEIAAAELMVFSDQPVQAVVIAASDLTAFRLGASVPVVARAEGIAGRSGTLSLPPGRLALAYRNTGSSPARFGAGVFKPESLTNRLALWTGTLQPGERTFTPFNERDPQIIQFLLLSGGLRASIVTRPEADRIALGAPTVPILGVSTLTDLPFASAIVSQFSGDSGFLPSVRDHRVLLIENPTDLEIGGFASVGPLGQDAGPPDALPPYASCRPVLARSRGVRGALNGTVLRTSLSRDDLDTSLVVECTSIPAGAEPCVTAPFSSIQQVSRRGDRAEFRLSRLLAISEGQFEVSVHLVAERDNTVQLSRRTQAFLVTIDESIEPPSSPRLDPSADRGSDDQDGVTSTGPLVFTGTGEAYARVLLLRNGRTVRAPSASVAPDGTWRISLDGAAPGVHAFSTRQLDEAGNLSEPSPPTTVRVVRPPAPPAVVTIPRSDRVARRDGVLVVTPRPTLQGRDAPGTLVALLVNGVEVGTVRTNSLGRWSFTLTGAIPSGTVSTIAALRRGEGGIDSAPGPALRVTASP